MYHLICDAHKVIATTRMSVHLSLYGETFGTNEELVSLTTGIVASAEINCDKAKEIGENILQKSIGNNFQDLKLKRNDKVKSLGFAHKTIKVFDQVSPVNSTQLFNRILCSCKSEDHLKECFKYELASYPLSLFDNGQLRKNVKSVLFAHMDKKCQPSNDLVDNAMFIVDGGYLLHKVIWQIPSTYGEIFEQYIKFVHYNYGSRCTIVFDGYDSGPTTKAQEQLRRSKKLGSGSADIDISDSALATLHQANFLNNLRNKRAFIQHLIKKLVATGLSVEQAEGDADTKIVSTSLSLRDINDSVVLVGEDTDLLVLLIHFATKDNIFMLRPGKLGIPNRITDISALQQAINPTIKDNILFIHAIGGCDTTSALYKQGKLKPLKLLDNNTKIQSLISIFKNPTTEKADVIKNGEQFLLHLYGKRKNIQTLDALRFLKYTNLTARQSLTRNFELATLPPTSDSAKYHCMRVYCQVQQWLQNSLNPLEWGWKSDCGELRPIAMDSEVAPDFILKMIFCNCKSGCKKICSCKKANIFCSNLCGNCNGNSCENVPEPVRDPNDSDEDLQLD